MAKILYGVAGEGSGHSMRTRAIAGYLAKEGHEITIFTSGRAYNNLKDDFEVHRISGPHFVYHNNAISQVRTVYSNFKETPAFTKNLSTLQKWVTENKPDIILTDFEPLTAFIASIRRLPYISVDNMHRLTHAKYKMPPGYSQDALTAKTVTSLMVNHADYYMISSFVPLQPTKKKAFVFPPVLREEVMNAKPSVGDHVLVYMSSGAEEVVKILKEINASFIVYGLEERGRQGNITFKAPSQEGFLKDLASANSVIANAGFMLISECLYLGKPFLAIPITRQFEQILNAHQLAEMGYGRCYEELDREKIEAFLFNVEIFREKLKGYKREDSTRFFKKLDSLINELVSRKNKKGLGRTLGLANYLTF